LYSNHFSASSLVIRRHSCLLTIACLTAGVPAVTLSTAPEETAAATRPTAIVIPFPGLQSPAGRGKAAPDPHARLAQALNSLEAALAKQRAAIAPWRGVLKELKSTTSNLDESLQRYRSSLRSLGSSVSALQAKARALEAWADKASQTQS
jgi:hypothetical protein